MRGQQRKDNCIHRYPFQKSDETVLPNSMYCLPNFQSGAYYIRWLSLRQIAVKNLIVTLDFSDIVSARYFASYFLPNSAKESNVSTLSLKDAGGSEIYFSSNLNGYGSETDDGYPTTKGRRLDYMLCDDDDFNNSNYTAVTPVCELSFNSDCQVDATIAYDDFLSHNKSVHNVQTSSETELVNKGKHPSKKSDNCYKVFRKLKSLCFRGCNALTDNDLSVVNPCRHLENLELVNCTKISDQGMIYLTEGKKFMLMVFVYDLL